MFSGYSLYLQPYRYGEPSREVMRVCVRLTWQVQKDTNPFLDGFALLDDPMLTHSVPVFAPFRYKTVIHTVLLNAQSPLRLRVLHISMIKRKHPPKMVDVSFYGMGRRTRTLGTRFWS